MFLEDVDHPSMLFKAHNKTKAPNPRPLINWDPPSITLPAWVLKRIFALECMGIFNECLLLTERLYRHNAFSFHLGYIRGRRRLYWLVDESGGTDFTIHWWASRPLSTLVSQLSMNVVSCKELLSPPDTFNRVTFRPPKID
jgi:hypothetical protein